MNLQTLVSDLAYNAGAVFAIEGLGLNGMIVTPSDSKMVSWVKTGVLWTVINELVMYMRTGSTYFSNGHYYIDLDDAGFNAFTIMFLEKSGLAMRVTSNVDNLLRPLGGNMLSDAVSTSLLKVSAVTLRNLIDASMQESPFQYVSHWTSLVPSLAKMLGSSNE